MGSVNRNSSVEGGTIVDLSALHNETSLRSMRATAYILLLDHMPYIVFM